MINVKKIYSGFNLQWFCKIGLLNYNNIGNIDSLNKYFLYPAENQDDISVFLYQLKVPISTF